MSDEGPPTRPRRPSSIAAITASELVRGWLNGAPGRAIVFEGGPADGLRVTVVDGETEWAEDVPPGDDLARAAHRAASNTAKTGGRS